MYKILMESIRIIFLFFLFGEHNMSNDGQPNNLDFAVDKNNLYREESVTDLKIATLRRLIPIKADGSEDDSRDDVFYGHTQLNSPQGPIPIHAMIEAKTLDKAIDDFPKAMEAEMHKVIENFKRMQEEQKKANDSRIIMPGQ